jgi:hypothetical protein
MATVLNRREERQYDYLKRFEMESLQELRIRAADLNIHHHMRMNKKELLQAIWRRYN